MEGQIVVTSKEELAQTLKRVILEIESEKQQKNNLTSLTINQVAKKLNRAHRTISKLIESGALKTTKDGRVPESELIRFMEG